MMRLLKRSHQGRPIEGRDVAFVAGIVFRFPGTSIGAILRSTNGAPAEARLVAFKAVLMLEKLYRRTKRGARIIQERVLSAGGAILIEGISSALYTRGESDSPAEGVMEKEPKGKRRRGKTK
jgi:hypothetical protein